MSMIMQYVRMRPDEVARLRDLLRTDPNGAFEYVDELADTGAEGADGRDFDTDRAWAAIDWLLTRAADAPVDVVYGGEELTGDDWGYEPPRYLSPAEVAAGSAYLSATPFAKLAAFYDPNALTAAGVYPEIWHTGQRSLEYVRHWYDGLVDFFARARAGGDAILMYLT